MDEVHPWFVSEGFIKTPIEPGKPEQSSGKPKPKPKPAVKNITKTKPRSNPSKSAFNEAESEVEIRFYPFYREKLGLKGFPSHVEEYGSRNIGLPESGLKLGSLSVHAKEPPYLNTIEVGRGTNDSVWRF